MKTIERTIKNNRGELLVVKMTVVGHKVGNKGGVARNRRVVEIIKSSVPVEIVVIGGTNGCKIGEAAFELTTGEENRMKTYPVVLVAGGDHTRNGVFKLFSVAGE